MIRLLLSGLLAAAAPSAAWGADMRPDDPILRTLLEGDAAQAGGNYAALLDTVQVLKALGATPAEGQEDLAALWAREASNHGVAQATPAFRGRALGPAYRRGSLVPGASLTMRQLFLGGQRAHILVAPAGGATSLSLRVQGADGATLCAKPVGGPQVDCAWMPLFTDRYNIVIENGGAAPASFFIVVR
ncbi:hypothetical protein MOK15_09735 [Sphingobium sp. BYY-5]|uniref:hypothetical protein n=1 Tax=Sphingobium sp. BYY-5 TaxID=2926400 RepID=UPI001FA6BAAD|nr:hypothetical protein [Sphingobium sp. BYY-5]MCI4590375.1 hypothetical protein [Sphingobium sp. BYY-5]